MIDGLTYKFDLTQPNNTILKVSWLADASDVQTAIKGKRFEDQTFLVLEG